MRIGSDKFLQKVKIKTTGRIDPLSITNYWYYLLKRYTDESGSRTHKIMVSSIDYMDLRREKLVLTTCHFYHFRCQERKVQIIHPNRNTIINIRFSRNCLVVTSHISGTSNKSGLYGNIILTYSDSINP